VTAPGADLRNAGGEGVASKGSRARMRSRPSGTAVEIVVAAQACSVPRMALPVTGVEGTLLARQLVSVTPSSERCSGP